jgi:hypothetical protein
VARHGLAESMTDFLKVEDARPERLVPLADARHDQRLCWERATLWRNHDLAGAWTSSIMIHERIRSG